MYKLYMRDFKEKVTRGDVNPSKKLHGVALKEKNRGIFKKILKTLLTREENCSIIDELTLSQHLIIEN